MKKVAQLFSICKKNHVAPGKFSAPGALHFIASAVLLQITSLAQAQNSPQNPPAAHAQLPTLVITAPAPEQELELAGQAVPLRQAPLSATIISREQLAGAGAQRLADSFRFDASTSDAYNAVGYIDYASVRGYVIDNQLNIRRDGLPISGNTAIGLSNKDRVEILKGTSGVMAGTSAPGGMVNYIVKRPTAQPVRSLDLKVDSVGQLGAALDLGTRFGQNNAQGLRLNFAADRLDHAAPGLRGRREQLALAWDTRIGQDALLEAELEWSKQSQPTLPGLSLLGSTGQLPAPDPKLNLNQQPWSLPTVFAGLTGSLRYTQALGEQWKWSAHFASQRLRTDDRVAFPYGCGNAGGGLCNAFYDNGDVDLYDYRSEAERRRMQSGQLKFDGSLHTGSIVHQLSLGVLQASARVDTPDYAYNYAGTINLNSPSTPVPSAPALTQPGNQQRETRTELFASDIIQWTAQLRSWLGLRHTRLQRSDASQGTNYTQSFTTPWLAATYALGSHTLYASYGQGIESQAVPNLPAYGAQAGSVLPVQRSRQFEVGLKSSWSDLWGAKSQSTSDIIVFNIRRPRIEDTGTSFIFDGQAQHRGIELAVSHTQALATGAWQVQGSATWLQARIRGAVANPALNGRAPTNVPQRILRLNTAYQFASHWKLGLHLSHEGKRPILPDNSLLLPAWTRVDASLQWDTRLGHAKSTWRLSIDNLFNRRYYRESPYQFGHVYLFPAAARTLRLSASFTL